MSYVMPNIPVDLIINPQVRGMAEEITSGPNHRMYAARPKNKNGRVQYVWRMVAFYLSRRPAHQCMPVTADFYLDKDDWARRREVIALLDDIVSQIVDSVPPSEWHGVARWSKAFYG